MEHLINPERDVEASSLAGELTTATDENGGGDTPLCEAGKSGDVDVDDVVGGTCVDEDAHSVKRDRSCQDNGVTFMYLSV